MAVRGGCALEGPTHWSLAAFADLERLPRSEQGRWCVWKSVELLYLLSAGGTADPPPGGMNPAIARAAAAARAYMSTHLDERLTIPELSRRFCVSATALKAAFRALYGQPIHSWLREKRMERAAELLRRSDMSVLDISQAVGFASPSQFGANFLKRFGAGPAPANTEKCPFPAKPRPKPADRAAGNPYNFLTLIKGSESFETAQILGLGRRDLHGHGHVNGL